MVHTNMKKTTTEAKNCGLSDEVVVRIAYDHRNDLVQHWSGDAAEGIRQADVARHGAFWSKAEKFSEQCRTGTPKGRKQSELFFGCFDGPDNERVLIYRTMQDNHPDMLSDYWFANRVGEEFDVRDLRVPRTPGIKVDHLAYCAGQIRKAVKAGQITNEKVNLHA